MLPWVLELILMDLIISALLHISYFFPNWNFNACSFNIFEVVNGGKITYSGDILPQGEITVVIAYHVNWADVYMILGLAIKAGMLSRCRWLSKIGLRWVPLLGWGILGTGMPMVTRNWLKEKTELDRGVVWCKENDKPIPKHLLYLRTKYFVTTVQHLRKGSHVKAVYDMTIAYSHNGKFLSAPTIWESLSCGGLSTTRVYKFHVHSELPQTDAEFAKWLETRWIAKGE
ncbi:hypothetical protein BJ878DRAFT_536139 [Calycina marina]|uniref:Phospholipid/glycerol acyltransferase domain-containing protein n=1 Tax=Calycina marina TaxID=1763456 RepID=A0A9P7YZD5_9HELO|nr:hypothetical protein BJ878DRAFT_536139 [Calycina marina]